MAEREFNLISVIKILLQWKKHIFIVTLIAAIGSIIISLFLQNYYKSTVLFYASNPKYLDPTLVFSEHDRDVFGTEEDSERLISIGNSAKIAFEIIQKFNLYKNYDIDSTNTKFHRTKILTTFRKYTQIMKTPEGAIEITVYDADRYIAADVANEMLTKIDYFNKQSIRNNMSSIVDLHKLSMVETEAKILQLNDSLENTRRKYNIYNPEVESELLTTELNTALFNVEQAKAELHVIEKAFSSRDTSVINLKAKIKGLEAKIKKITSTEKSLGLNLKSFIEGADVIVGLEYQMELLAEQHSEIADQYNKTTVGLNSKFSSVYVIERAAPADRKSKPIRSLIVLSSTLIACFFSIFVVLFIEYYQKEIKELFK
ncbi:MAG: hypothetical protein FVQ77_01555 [Cytophagales bacterium]|nr:hypothetical protein [Cytophagales bacterium]